LVGYVVTPYVGATAQDPILLGTETSTTVSGLVDGTAYTFQVAARNARGTGPAATSKVLVPGVAAPPTGLKLTGGTGSVSLSWSPAASPSAVVGHVITPYRAGVAQAPQSFGPSPAAVVTGLDDGVSYTFRVSAINAAGVGLPATSKAIVPGAPGVPGSLKVTAGSGSVTVTWTAAPSPAGPVLGHVITPYIGSVAQPAQSFGPGSSAVVTGLQDGTTYTVKVAAVNLAGPGPAATSKKVVPGVPSAPTGVRAVAGEGSVALTWTAASSSAGPVLQHIVTPYIGAAPQAPQAFGPGTTAVVAGLTDGIAYTFKVAAANVAGTGAQATTPRVTPGTPGAPTGHRATVPEPGTARASWDLGSPSPSVTGYRVTPVIDGVVQAAVEVGMVGQLDLPGLAPGARVTFRIQAINAHGAGPNAITGRVTV
jgi:titin